MADKTAVCVSCNAKPLPNIPFFILHSRSFCAVCTLYQDPKGLTVGEQANQHRAAEYLRALSEQFQPPNYCHDHEMIDCPHCP